MDDIFVIWCGNEKSKELQDKFTMSSYGLKLALDQKEKHRIHFLDVEILVEHRNKWMRVYRKPSNVPVIIPHWSNDKWCYKIAALKSYVSRAITHSSTEEFLNEEIVKIIRVAEKYGYSKRTVKRLFNKILKTKQKMQHKLDKKN